MRTADTAYGSASALLAYARLRELQRSGRIATVTDSAGRPLDAQRLEAIAAAEARPPRPS